MKLLYTITAYPPSVGGAQEHLHQLASRFAAQHEVQVAAHWDSTRRDWLLGTTARAPRPARDYEVDGVRVHRLAYPPGLNLGLWAAAALYPLAQGPAIAHIAGRLAEVLTPLADVDLIHNVRIGREGLSAASLKLARQRDVPFVFTPLHHPRWSGWLHRHFHKLCRQADLVIALTESERRTLEAQGVAPERIAVTGHGPVVSADASSERFRARHRLGRDPMILFLGQKYAYKGLAAILEAAPRVWDRQPETRFVFVGPRTAYSKRLFSGVRDPRILELDAVDLQTKSDALAACDVFCLPSTQESFGGVFTEAWAFGRPVLGADIPAVREVIADGVDGLVCDPRPAPLAAHLQQLLFDERLRHQLGEAGRRKVTQRFTWPKLVEQTEALYEAVLHGRSPRADHTIAVTARQTHPSSPLKESIE